MGFPVPQNWRILLGKIVCKHQTHKIVCFIDLYWIIEFFICSAMYTSNIFHIMEGYFSLNSDHFVQPMWLTYIVDYVVSCCLIQLNKRPKMVNKRVKMTNDLFITEKGIAIKFQQRNSRAVRSGKSTISQYYSEPYLEIKVYFTGTGTGYKNIWKNKKRSS